MIIHAIVKTPVIICLAFCCRYDQDV